MTHYDEKSANLSLHVHISAEAPQFNSEWREKTQAFHNPGRAARTDRRRALTDGRSRYDPHTHHHHHQHQDRDRSNLRGQRQTPAITYRERD